MKPVISTDMQKLVLRVFGTALLAVAASNEWTWRGVLTAFVGALGGALGGTTKLGPGHVELSSLPLDVQESVRPPAGPG